MHPPMFSVWMPRRCTNATSVTVGWLHPPTRVNASQVRNRGVRNGGLVAHAHVKLVNAAQVHKRRVRHFSAVVHAQLPQPGQVHKVGVRHPLVGLPDPERADVGRRRPREARAPARHVAADASVTVVPLVTRYGVAALHAARPHLHRVGRGDEGEDGVAHRGQHAGHKVVGGEGRLHRCDVARRVGEEACVCAGQGLWLGGALGQGWRWGGVSVNSLARSNWEIRLRPGPVVPPHVATRGDGGLRRVRAYLGTG